MSDCEQSKVNMETERQTTCDSPATIIHEKKVGICHEGDYNCLSSDYYDRCPDSYTSSPSVLSVSSKCSTEGEYTMTVEQDYLVRQTEQLSVLQEPKRCVICGDKGTGYHYSVYSCEGCKGFFKRYLGNLSKKMEMPVCRNSNACVIDKSTRNQCQACRLAKCLEKGMTKDVTKERGSAQPKRKNTERLDEFGVKKSALDAHDNTPSPETMMEFLKEVLQTNPFVSPEAKNSCPTDDILAKQSREHPSQNCPPDGGDPSSEGLPNIPHDAFTDMISLAYHEVWLIVDWAKKVPGYKDLPQEDKIQLLKNSFIELNVLRMTYRSINSPPKHLNFGVGFDMSPEYADLIGFGGDLHKQSVDTVEKFKQMEIDEIEFALLNIIILFSASEMTGMKEEEKVKNLRNSYSDRLAWYIRYKYPKQPDRYTKLLTKITTLRTISMKAIDNYQKILVSTSNHTMDQLVAELFSA